MFRSHVKRKKKGKEEGRNLGGSGLERGLPGIGGCGAGVKRQEYSAAPLAKGVAKELPPGGDNEKG